MSFPNQGFWIEKSSDCINDGNTGYHSSPRGEPKQSQQWFLDGPETELFPNKKQAVEVPSTNLFTGMLNSNRSQWSTTSNFQSMSGQFSERVFAVETARTVNFDTRNISSVSSEKINMGKKVDENLFGSDSPFGLAMSYPVHDFRSTLNFGGIRKVKVSQVKESDNIFPVSMEHAYGRVDVNTMSMGHTYGKADENSMSVSIVDTYDRETSMFISTDQPYGKEDESVVMSQPYKVNESTLLMGHAFSKADDHGISMSQTFEKVDENFISMGNVHNTEHVGIDSLRSKYNKNGNSDLSIGQSYNKGESTIISFGGYNDNDSNSSARLISGYDLLTTQACSKKPEVSEKELGRSSTDGVALTALITVSGTDDVSRKKDDSKLSKKVPLNSFPSNVRSLLSTGMLDGVPVKYIAWSLEKELPGIIKGVGYLCSCQACNFSKVINAYEFERHANCKTKHPNNHIYFENGKTIYSIVQELRSTPQSILFDVIQTITGSPINQKSFRLWKESFVAATRELQRIYGKDEGNLL